MHVCGWLGVWVYGRMGFGDLAVAPPLLHFFCVPLTNL